MPRQVDESTIARRAQAQVARMSQRDKDIVIDGLIMVLQRIRYHQTLERVQRTAAEAEVRDALRGFT